METPEQRHDRRQTAYQENLAIVKGAGFPCDEVEALILAFENHDRSVHEMEHYGGHNWWAEVKWAHPLEPKDDRVVWIAVHTEGETLLEAVVNTIALYLWAVEEYGL